MSLMAVDMYLFTRVGSPCVDLLYLFQGRNDSTLSRNSIWSGKFEREGLRSHYN